MPWLESFGVGDVVEFFDLVNGNTVIEFGNVPERISLFHRMVNVAVAHLIAAATPRAAGTHSCRCVNDQLLVGLDGVARQLVPAFEVRNGTIVFFSDKPQVFTISHGVVALF